MNDGKHNLRFVSSEKRKRIQYATDKRREERGVKVVHIHTQITKRNWPSMEKIGQAICDHYHKMNELCNVIYVAFDSSFTSMDIPVYGLGLPDDRARTMSSGAYLVSVQVRMNCEMDHGTFDVCFMPEVVA